MTVRKEKIKESCKIGYFRYTIEKSKLEEIQKAKNVDLKYKYEKYVSWRKTEHKPCLSEEIFTKVYNKAKKIVLQSIDVAEASEKLRDYTKQLFKEEVLNTLSVYLNWVCKNNTEEPWCSGVTNDGLIYYRFIKKDIVKITKTIGLPEYVSEEFKKDTEFPFLIFAEKAIGYSFYPADRNIYKYCKHLYKDYKNVNDFVDSEKRIIYVA